ncbi:MAG: sodium:proton antiporter [Oscillospiraceae bacterium]|nr:sodium:proton antiporter [Oscillospiraceae bacterium]
MEMTIIILFCVLLLLCVIFDIPLLIALIGGLGLFWLYGFKKGFGPKQLLSMMGEGIKTVKNILITFMLIGMLTALWRAGGTIPVIVSYAIKLIHPSVFLPMVFITNCFVSILTGTAFGTAATMGVICTTMSAAVGANPLLVGGAILSGVFFGDRCSPVSTSALLVSELTKTDIFDNIKNMIKSCAVPFDATVIVYFAIGLLNSTNAALPDLQAIFAQEFVISPIAVIPAAVIIVLALMKKKVKFIMIVSIIVSIPVCIFVQGVDIAALPKMMVMGFTAHNAQVAAMMNGGGMVSMLKAGAIVCISSSYSGIFKQTGLLDGIEGKIAALYEKTSSYTATLIAAAAASMVACNQTLAIILTFQLCQNAEKDNRRFAINLEDTAVVVAALVPWSIASGVPLAAAGADLASIPFAVFLYILPVWRLITCRRNVKW